MSHLVQAEIDRLILAVQQRCDRTTQSYLERLLTENRELRDQAAERQFMYDLEPEG